MMMNRIAPILFAVLALASCKKYEDKVGVAGDQLTNSYCNDPEAVNYNWGFPGKPDNTLCFYPTDSLIGTYFFRDTIFYSQDMKFTRVDSFEIALELIDRTRFRFRPLKNSVFCSDDVVNFKADKFFKATADSTWLPDSVQIPGQALKCRRQDTLSGFITTTSQHDKKIKINFTVISDTGSKLTYHIGTATKIK
jgi:hypothetical protein